MQVSITVLLILGCIHVVDAALSFDPVQNQELLEKLTAVNEQNELVPTDTETLVSRLTCIDDSVDPSERSKKPRFTEVSLGGEFIRLRPTNRDFTDIYAYSLDYEKVSGDKDQDNRKKLNIKCEDYLGNEFIIFEAFLVVNDVNDQIPEFVRTTETYRTQIDEILDPTKLPLLIYTNTNSNPIVVKDDDGPNNNQVTAQCDGMYIDGSSVKQSCDEYFEVEAKSNGSGKYYFNIKALRSVYTGMESIRLTIIAKNTPLNEGEVLKSKTQNVIILIRDLQTEPPLIDKNSLSFTMLESLQPGGQLVGYIEAFDQDTGDPHPIKFKIVTPANNQTYAFENQLFKLGDAEELIDRPDVYRVPVIVNNTVDRELIPDITKTLYLGIQALEYDPLNRPNRPKGTAQETFSIRVEDVNDITPTFSSETYRISVTELFNHDTNPEIFRQISNEVDIRVEDTDSSIYSGFTVKIISGNNDGNFELGRNSGNGLERFVLLAKQKILDYETLPNDYQLTLEAVDDDQPSRSSSATVFISITDANDHAPTFTKPTVTFNILESKGANTVLGSVTATDKDSGLFGNIVDYKIIDDSTETFSIDKSGTIKLTKEVDYESNIINYYFTVVAYDGGVGNERKEGSVNINVQLINEIDSAPEFDDFYTAELFEESKVLIPQIQVQAQNREAGLGPITYNIESVSPLTVSPTAFKINSVTGDLTVEEYINYKDTDPVRQGLVSVNVSARTGNLASFTTITISVIDINNFAPEFIPTQPNNIYRVTINESYVAGQDVFKLNVEDKDGIDSRNGQVVFQAQSGTYNDFVILRDSGTIKISNEARLDIQQLAEYTIVVVALDLAEAPKSASATVIVTVDDTNNKDPVFVNALYRFQVNADDAIGKVVGTVSATDVDSNSLLTYSINYSTVTFEKEFTTVTDIFDPSAVIDMTSAGQIQVAGVIDREKYDRINMKVVVEDKNADTQNQLSRQTATASVVIFILAAVDPAIYFSNDGWDKVDQTIGVTFKEAAVTNYQILTLRATDPEIPATVTNYRKRFNSDPNDYFSIQGSRVFIKKALDYEELQASQREVSMVVEALSGGKTGTATVIVTVEDLNDNQPKFEENSYSFEVDEGKTSPYIVGRVKATDLDSSSYGEVAYNLTGTQGDFKIYIERSGSESEAVIYVAENHILDFEETPVYNLVLLAYDNPRGVNDVKFVTSVDVEITLRDINDMSPVFSENVYNITIVGTTEVNGEVFRIRATDGDAEGNGQVFYRIVGATDNGDEYFGIETVTQTSPNVGEVWYLGQIYVKSSLEDLSDRMMFKLYVNASDPPANGGDKTPDGSCIVIITVSKGVQDLKPQWKTTTATIEIPEEQPIGTSVIRMEAIPAVKPATILYSFVKAGDELRDYDSFNIDRNTGLITTTARLDYEEKEIYNYMSNDMSITLLVLATDSLNSSLTNQYLLVVQLTDIDDNNVSFADCPDKVYSVPEYARVDEARPSGVFVYAARACDRDYPPFNKVKYSWFIDSAYCSAENLKVFTLNETTGQVFTQKPLDREDTAKYTLCIEASSPEKTNPEKDLQSLNRTNKLLFVEVTVDDKNDLGPKFYEPKVTTVMLPYPDPEISVAEAYDNDGPGNDRITYTIENIDFTIRGKTQNAPTAFTINANDGKIGINAREYTDNVGGYFDITVKAQDYKGAPVPTDSQLQRVYVTDRAHRIRVVFDEPADEGVDQKAKDMIKELNDRFGDAGMYFEIETISYHAVSNNADPSFDKTDVCLVVVEKDVVLSQVSASSRLTENDNMADILEKYGAADPGSCDPAVSVYPIGWESYWWVLVAFAIFIFVCCLISIVLICVLYKQYKQYMDSRKTYLVPGN